MSTRANLLIKYETNSWKFELGFYPIPKDVIPSLLKMVKKDFYSIDLNYLNDQFGSIGLGFIGNFDYFYEVDFNTKIVNAWKSQTYWVNAPDDWEERGWKCYKGDNGRYGYTDWRKGKKIDLTPYVFDDKL